MKDSNKSEDENINKNKSEDQNINKNINENKIKTNSIPHNAHDLSGKERESKLNLKEEVRGPNFERDLTIFNILRSFKNTGIQATNLYNAIEEIKKMRKDGAKIYFGCTSNIISSGLREIVAFMAKHKYLDVFVCSAGGIEEDIIKCLKPFYLADFRLDGKELRETGMNRIGNMIVPNENYFEFEKFMNEFVDEILDNGIPIEQPGGHIDCLEKLCKYSNDKQTVDSKTIISPKQLNSDDI